MTRPAIVDRLPWWASFVFSALATGQAFYAAYLNCPYWSAFLGHAAGYFLAEGFNQAIKHYTTLSNSTHAL